MLTRCNLDSPQERARYHLEMHAVMAWPKEPAKQRNFLCSLGAAMADFHADAMEGAKDEAMARNDERWRDLWEQVYAEYGGRRCLLKAPSDYDIHDDYCRKVKDAYLAGHVLNFCIQLHRDEGLSDHASIRKAKEIVYKHVSPETAALWDLPRSHRPVDEAWASHRCVAHIASAIMNVPSRVIEVAVNRRANGRMQLTLSIERQELLTLVRGAATIQKLAARIIPHGQTAPVLPASEIIGSFRNVQPFADDEVAFHPLSESVATKLHKGARR